MMASDFPRAVTKRYCFSRCANCCPIRGSLLTFCPQKSSLASNRVVDRKVIVIEDQKGQQLVMLKILMSQKVSFIVAKHVFECGKEFQEGTIDQIFID
jgi:hypothetical protein